MVQDWVRNVREIGGGTTAIAWVRVKGLLIRAGTSLKTEALGGRVVLGGRGGSRSVSSASGARVGEKMCRIFLSFFTEKFSINILKFASQILDFLLATLVLLTPCL